MTVTIVDLQRKYVFSNFKIKFAAQKILQSLNMKPQDLSIVFVTSSHMQRLNKKYLKHDYVTDVITFGHGEIIICPSVAAGNAKALGNTFQQEIMLYVAHGILHLAGYNDHTPKEILKMRMMEQKIMASLCSSQ